MQLVPHPTTITSLVKSIDAALWHEAGRWHFRYLVDGIHGLILPDPSPAVRTDDLWRHSCFEAFVGLGYGAYLEFNLSPSTQWAAYRFDRYRDARSDEPVEIDIIIETGETWFALEAVVKCSTLTEGSSLGLSAVIEERGGKSYWALAHPDGPPDFHNRDCFVARLPPVEAP